MTLSADARLVVWSLAYGACATLASVSAVRAWRAWQRLRRYHAVRRELRRVSEDR